MNNEGILSNKNIASLTLLVLSVQFCALEGETISMYKVVYMGITPLLLLLRSPRISKAIILSILFWATTYLMIVLQFENQRLSTLYYSLFYLSAFCLFYNLVWEEKCFQLEEAIVLVRFLIRIYVIFLLLQQLAMLVGIRYLPFINLYGTRWQGLFHLSSLAIEPSHAARLMTVFMYAFLKLVEFSQGRPITLSEMFGRYRWTVWGFLYFMLAIGSGTAMAGLGILSLYFLRPQYAIVVVTVVLLFYLITPFIDYEPLNRAMTTFDAALSMDETQVTKADQSASTRVNQLISLKYTDLSDYRTWFGRGIDAPSKGPTTIRVVYEYGMISYLLKLLLYFSCSICGLFSLSSLMFVFLFTMNIGNVAYCFAALMVFSLVKYFMQEYVRE
ncbi:MAG: hypothetical protein J6Y32_03585 [Bacteroidales bacterium]|nr:hypothetical protein [Bacteroidales bacterium]